MNSGCLADSPSGCGPAESPASAVSASIAISRLSVRAPAMSARSPYLPTVSTHNRGDQQEHKWVGYRFPVPLSYGGFILSPTHAAGNDPSGTPGRTGVPAWPLAAGEDTGGTGGDTCPTFVKSATHRELVGTRAPVGQVSSPVPGDENGPPQGYTVPASSLLKNAMRGLRHIQHLPVFSKSWRLPLQWRDVATDYDGGFY